MGDSKAKKKGVVRQRERVGKIKEYDNAGVRGWSYVGIGCGKAGEKGLKVIGRGDKTREGMLRRRVGGWLGRALEKEIFVLKKSLGKVQKSLRTLG